jgi:hypothetical protein
MELGDKVKAVTEAVGVKRTLADEFRCKSKRRGIMKLKLIWATVVLASLSAIPAAAQDRSHGGFSDQFTFDGTGAVVTWNGVANAYYGDMGSVSIQSQFGGGYGSAIDVPWQLGYLNNGFLSPCDPMVPSAKVWTIGDGTHIGDAFTQHFATTCPYFTGEWGSYNNSTNRLDSFSVDANYVYVKGPRTCPRFKPCYYPIVVTLAGGSGTVTDSIINQ